MCKYIIFEGLGLEAYINHGNRGSKMRKIYIKWISSNKRCRVLCFFLITNGRMRAILRCRIRLFLQHISMKSSRQCTTLRTHTLKLKANCRNEESDHLLVYSLWPYEFYEFSWLFMWFDRVLAMFTRSSLFSTTTQDCPSLEILSKNTWTSLTIW